MRLVFMTLLLANASLYGWASFKGQWFPQLQKSKSSETPSVRPVVTAQNVAAQSIQLLSESDPVELPERVTEKLEEVLSESTPVSLPEEPEEPARVSFERDNTASVVASQSLCRMVGPFKNDVVANAFIERLATLDVEASLNNREISEGERYWVYLEPLPDRKAARARLAELTELGIDSYIIQRGSLKHGISLGVFSRERLARERLKNMARLGLNAQLVAQERAYRELWVMLGVGEDQKIGGVGWSNLLKDQPKLESRQSFCVLDVASEGNFH